MKILELTTNISEGSVARIVKDLYDVIKDSGHECIIAYGRGICSNKYNCIKIGNKLDVYVHALLSRFTDRAGFYSKKATKKFLNKIESYSPDIIHIHCLHGYYINIVELMNFIRKKNIPVVWTFHDCWAFTGHCTYFDNCGCEKWKKLCMDCQQTRSFPASYFIDNSANNYINKKELFSNITRLTIVTPSNWLEQITKYSFLGKRKIVTINNGIDTDTFKFVNSSLREQYNIVDKKIILGVAGVWNERKGLKTFFKLSDILSEDYKIVLIGLDKEDIGKYAEKIITIRKTQSKEELAAWYSIADIFVNPTIEDNYPTVNLEAIACGTPVITYNTGGSSECLKFGNGIVVDKGDFEGLVYAINNGVDINKKSNKISYIDKKYCFSQYMNLFEEIMNEKN